MSESSPVSTTDSTEQVPYFPMRRAESCPFDPAPGVRALVAEKPLARVRIWDGSTPWLVTGHTEQRTLLADPHISVDDRLPGFPHWNQGLAVGAAERPRMLVNSDPPEHGRYRRMLTYPFTTKRVEALRPAIQQITDQLFDTMLAGPKPADLVTALALPVPSLMISDLLGVPYADHEFFQHHAEIGADRNATAEQHEQGPRVLIEYLTRLLETKMTEPAEDMSTELAKRVQAGELTMPEAAIMGVSLLIAGHETSANMIALGTLALLEHPDQLAVLREADDPKVVADAVEELLRYLSIIHSGQRRVATDDIEIDGEVIHSGEGVIMDFSAANWDPSVFAEPEHLNLHQPARQHHAFGFGIHQCVGQQLARVELQVAFPTLFRRIPTLGLATTIDKIPFKNEGLAYGVYELPVTW
jgi:cytochrome P450